MQQAQNSRQNVGWYTLAQLISRHEKERALSVLKLLAYSFNDEAFTLQVIGDVLAAFNDQQAIVQYCAAAQAYRADGRLRAAACIYEHLVTMQQPMVEHLAALCELYAELGDETSLSRHWHNIVGLHSQGVLRVDEMLRIALRVREVLTEKNADYQLLCFEELVRGTAPALGW